MHLIGRWALRLVARDHIKQFENTVQQFSFRESTLLSRLLTVPEERDPVMVLPFILGELPLMSILVVLLGGVAPACDVLPGGTVDVSVDDVLVFMIKAVRQCEPCGAMSESSRTKGTAPLSDEGPSWILCDLCKKLFLVTVAQTIEMA